MKVTRHLLRTGKYNKYSEVVKKEKRKRVGLPDPRERNYPEDLEGLTEGERKLMKK